MLWRSYLEDNNAYMSAFSPVNRAQVDEITPCRHLSSSIRLVDGALNVRVCVCLCANNFNLNGKHLIVRPVERSTESHDVCPCAPIWRLLALNAPRVYFGMSPQYN